MRRRVIWDSLFFGSPSRFIAGVDFFERFLHEVSERDVLGICEANEDEQQVAEFFFDVCDFFELVCGFKFFCAFCVTDGSGQFAEFFGESGELNEGREVTLFELSDPFIDAILSFIEGDGRIFWEIVHI